MLPKEQNGPKQLFLKRLTYHPTQSVEVPSLYDWLVRNGPRHLKGDVESLRKVALGVRFCFVAGGVSGALGLTFLAMGGPAMSVFTLAISVFVTSLPAVLWLGLSLRWWSVLLTFATLLLTVTYALAQGTPLSSLPWLVVPLLMARILGDTYSGYAAMVAAVVGVSVMFVAQAVGVTPAAWIPPDPPASQWINLCALFIVVLSIGDVGARGYEDAVQRVLIKKQRLQDEVDHHLATQAELAEAHARVVQTARVAGMAEIATGVLHNVGNALNTVSVTAQVVRNGVGNTETVKRLERVADLVESGTAQPEAVATFLRAMAKRARSDCDRLSKDMTRLAGAVEHVANVVNAQQAHARSRGVVETVSVGSIIRDVLPLTQPKLDRHEVAVKVSGELDATLTTERHQVVQIVENLVRNAAEALAPLTIERRIRIHVATQEDHVRIRVIDNGTGVAPEDREMIFAHGFTRKATGSGFGLHHSSMTCKSMGGRLELDDVPGAGACFSLWLPIESVRMAEDDVTEVFERPKTVRAVG